MAKSVSVRTAVAIAPTMPRVPQTYWPSSELYAHPAPGAMAQWMGHTVGRSNWSFSAIWTAHMVQRKAAEDFPIAARCARCRARACARDSSAYRSRARPTPLSSRAQAKTVHSAHRRSARARCSVAKSAAHKS